jgi:hypothetical protein
MAEKFREAMDTACVSPSELADHMGVHVQRVKQARLDPDATGYRPPPTGWEEAVLELATRRGGAIQALADELRKEAGEG